MSRSDGRGLRSPAPLETLRHRLDDLAQIGEKIAGRRAVDRAMITAAMRSVNVMAVQSSGEMVQNPKKRPAPGGWRAGPTLAVSI